MILGCNGQIVGQPRKGECRQNVRKMSRKNLQKLSEGLRAQFSDIFWTILAYLVNASLRAQRLQKLNLA